MKIDKSNFWHWVYLSVFSLNVCLALIARAVWFGRKSAVILYGHKLNGNLKALHDYSLSLKDGARLVFLTMDPIYYQKLKQQKIPVLSGLNPLHMLRLATAYAIVSDHGLHALILLLRYSSIRFVDVWHGIPFKGFDSADFKVQHNYAEVWVPSIRLRQLYIEKFGFDENILKVTGYARTDRLVQRKSDLNQIRSRIGIPQGPKVILFAPTWQQDDAHRNIYPFGITESDFLKRMDSFCHMHEAVCILRKHLNVKVNAQQGEYSRILHRSYEDYPDAEEILLMSDVLICDWSSIAFDYLLLNRPALFLNVAAPFKKGFSLDASYRFGPIINGMEEMYATLARFLNNPESYQSHFGATHARTREELYGEFADGRSAERGYNRLLALADRSS